MKTSSKTSERVTMVVAVLMAALILFKVFADESGGGSGSPTPTPTPNPTATPTPTPTATPTPPPTATPTPTPPPPPPPPPPTTTLPPGYNSEKDVFHCECDCEGGGKWTQEPGPASKPADKPTDSSGNCPTGMAVYGLNFATTALTIQDIPFSYHSPYGPSPVIQFTYTEGEFTNNAPFSNIGPSWKVNCIQFLQQPIDDLSSVSLDHGQGGSGALVADGAGGYTSAGSKDKTKARPDGVFVRTLPQHTAEEYEFVSDTPLLKRSFLTRVADPDGNAVTLAWTAQPTGARLDTVTDAAGRIVTFAYENSNFPLRISKISDPYGRTVTLTYNAAGQLWKLTDAVGIVSEFVYAPGTQHRITTMTTPYGSTAFNRGQIVENNKTIGNWIEATDPNARTERMEYREETPVAQMPGEIKPAVFSNAALNKWTTFYWNRQGYAAGLSRSNAMLIRWCTTPPPSPEEPDKIYRTESVSSIKQPLMNRVWFRYPGEGTPGTIGGSAHYNGSTQLQPDGSWKETSNEEGADGLASSETDSEGRTITYDMHPTGQLWKVRVSRGATEHVLYRAEDYVNRRPQKIYGVDGTLTQFTYNARGQIKTITNPKGDLTQIEYYGELPEELPTAANYGRRKAVKLFPDTAQELKSAASYDPYGRMAGITSPENKVTTVEYDAIGGDPLKTLNRPTRITHPGGKTEWVVWNRLDVGESYDIEGKKTTYAYDAARNLTSVTGPDGKTIQYVAGNCCGSIDTLVDAGGNQTHWKYDLLGRELEKWLKWDPSTPGGNGAVRVKLSTYDAVGRPVTSTDARGNVRTLVYNADGKMSDINYTIMPGTAATPNVHVTYETAAESVFGRVKTVADTMSHAEQYEYVPFNPADTQYGDGRLRVVTTTGSHTVTYLYDILGRRVTSALGLSGSADALTTRGWDDYGRLTSLTNLLGTETLHYDGKSGRVAWTTLNNLKTSYGYDTTSGPGEHRLGSIGHTWDDAANNYTDHAYGYDGSGRLTSWAKSADGATKLWTMGYDASEQLETVSETVGTALANVHHYTYDAAGNRTSEQRSGGVRSWAANQFNQLTNQTVGGEMELRGTVAPKSTVKIDGQAAQMREGGVPAASGTEWRKKTNAAAGQNTFALKATEDAPPGFVPRVLNKTIEVNIQPVPQITFAYDADGNMTTDGLNSYVWDAENRLVSVWNSTIGLVEFGYDAFSRRVSLSEKPDGITANKSLRLMWEGLTLVGQVDTASSVNNHTRLFFGNGERRVSTIGAAVNLYYTRDHLGSIRELVDASTGAIRARYDYTPYGIRTKVQSSGDLDSDFGFTGHYTNERTGLVLAPYRAYSPELGRWISRDPIEEDGGINLYGYVGNGPLQWFDHLGLRLAHSGISQITITTISGGKTTFDVSSYNDFRWKIYKLTEYGNSIEYLEILGHGSTCGKDPMAGNDEEAFIGLIGSRLSSKPSVYINGCETATWAEYLSKQKGWENATVYGNSDNIYGKIGALLELSKKGYKNGEEIK